jgi:alkaline phosphatase
VLGVPQVANTLQFKRSGDKKKTLPYEIPLTESIPTLAEMTQAALNVLDNDPDGLFLMIEGGAIDWAGHGNSSGRVIEEEIDFNKAVDAVVAWVEKNSSWDETLVIVTGDHETGYLLGPGSGPGTEGTPVFASLKNNGKGKLPGMQWNSGGHTNSLIPIYAKGNGSKALAGRVVGKDPRRGDYIDNTSIANTVFALWGLK